MSGSQLVALIVGVVGGGTAAALLTTASERREKFRDRLLEAASDFLEWQAETLRALEDYRRRTSDEWEGMQNFLAATEARKKAFLDSPEAAFQVENILTGHDLVRGGGEFDAPWSDETAAEIAKEHQQAEEALSQIQDPEAADALLAGRAWLRASYNWGLAASRQRASFAKWHEVRRTLTHSAHKTRILFARSGRDDVVATRLGVREGRTLGGRRDFDASRSQSRPGVNK